MLFRLRDRIGRYGFAQAASGVLDTAPLSLTPGSSTMLFSQLQHKDVLLGLVAFKSFAAQVPVGACGILDDGSLTPEDRALLARHLPGVRFVDLAEVRTPACPQGGCWERILWIARLSREHHVVQLDSDTLTLGPIPEVADALAAGRSFAIGTWDRQVIETMAFRQGEAARHLAKVEGKPHVQLVAEAHFDRLADWQQLRYVRGCAGFSAFARGRVDLAFIERLSSQMEAAIGRTWHEWGSEQVMSNLVVANDPDAIVLPHPKYCDCTRLKDGAAFVHFIGSCRFTGGTYARMAERVIRTLPR